MADFISRDKAAKVLCKACGNAACDPFECSFYKEMEDIPAANVWPVVRGEWIEDDYGFVRCSNCGMEWDEPEHPKTNYCPSCGAKMQKELTYAESV